MTLSVGLWKDPIVCPPLYGGSFGGLSWPLSPVSEGSNSSNWAFGIPSRRTAGGKGSAVATVLGSADSGRKDRVRALAPAAHLPRPCSAGNVKNASAIAPG